jgi:thymidylate synthase
MNTFTESLEATATGFGVTRSLPDAETAYRKALADVLATDCEIVGGETESIGSKKRFKEILHYSFLIENPRERLIWNAKRKLNLPAAVGRFVWMMAGNDRLYDIEFYEKKVAAFTDDGIIVPGSNYGHRMKYADPGCDQIAGAVSRLKKDPATRRAAIAVFSPEDATRVSHDIPCTFGLAFHNRGEFLHASVIMRSNNAYVLLPYNIFEFSLLGEAVAAEIGLKLGAMAYYAMSMHVYATDYGKAQNVTDAGRDAQSTPVPEMPRSPSPLDQIRELVRIEVEVRHAAAAFSSRNFESKWIPFADSRLDPYWRQFYYMLLLAMCQRVGFSSGVAHLREFIDEPWLSCVPSEVMTPHASHAVAQPDLFQEIETKSNVSQTLGSVPNATANTSVVGSRPDSTVISRADLEQELEQVLKLYRPHVATDQWSRVVAHQPIFIERATSSQQKVVKVFQRLRNLRFSLEKGEKVEAYRARAEVIIRGLEELTAD